MDEKTTMISVDDSARIMAFGSFLTYEDARKLIAEWITKKGIRTIDLRSGIRRILKEQMEAEGKTNASDLKEKCRLVAAWVEVHRKEMEAEEDDISFKG